MTKPMLDKDVFGKRLKYLMDNYNENTYSMSRIFNLSAPSISRYTRGEMAPKITTIRAMAAYFDVNPDWLMGQNVSMYLGEPLETGGKWLTMSVFDTIAYDKPIFSNEKADETLSFPAETVSGWGSVFALKIKDEVMAPTLCQNDTAVIQLSPEKQAGDFIALHVDGGDMVIRKVSFVKNLILLQPYNPAFTTDVYNMNQSSIHFIGRVVYNRRFVEHYFTQPQENLLPTQ